MDLDFRRKTDIIRALGARGAAQDRLFARARKIRDAVFSGRVEVRSVMEYSNICGQECVFCGMSRDSRVKRYIMREPYFIGRIKKLYGEGRRIIMVQAGEYYSARYFDRLRALLREAKSLYPDLVLLCSFGSMGADAYRMLRDIGIERYLLKFETSDPRLYKRIKPSDTLRNRIAHIRTLKKIGFQVSSGNITGLPGQTLASVADDLVLLKDLALPMGGTSVFIPNELSRFGNYPPGDLDTALNFMAVLRIMNPCMLICTTSSLSLIKRDGVSRGLAAGANVVTMHDGTPRADERNYVIYTKARYRPRRILFDIVRAAGLEAGPYSLLRDRPEGTLFSALVGANLARNGKAVYSEGRTYTYRDLLSLSSKFCSFLIKRGIREHDTVLLALHDSIEFVVAFLSCIRLGIIVVPLDPRMGAEERDAVISGHGASMILAAGSLRGKMCRGRVIPVARDDSSDFFLSFLKKQPSTDLVRGVDKHNPALILYTSGTTGAPKGAVHTYRHLLTDNFPRTVVRMRGNDISFSCSRLSSGFGLESGLLFPFRFGGGTILSRAVPNPWTIQNIGGDIKPTLFYAVPSMFEFLLRHQEEVRDAFRNVRLFIASGEKLYDDVWAQWEAAFQKPLLECFGSSEMSHSFIAQIPGRRKASSCGKVVEGFQVKFSRTGIMFCKGPSLFTGYYGDSRLSKNRLRGGWFRSDDIGYADAQGYIFLRGRKNLVFKSKGVWVSAADIENKLKRSGLVKDAAVLARKKGLDICVVMDRQAGGEQDCGRLVRRYCLDHLSLRDLPEKIHIVREIPRTAGGKIDRRSFGHG